MAQDTATSTVPDLAVSAPAEANYPSVYDAPASEDLEDKHSAIEDEEENPIYEIFSRDVRIPGIAVRVHGEDDPEAYRKLPHMLNTARSRHTLQGADEPQLSGVLPISKSLQKAVKTEQARWKKTVESAKKLEKQENTWRDDMIRKIERCLEKDDKELKSVLEAENKKLSADARQTPEEIDDVAKKLKWRHWKQYDRVVTQAHLDNMSSIYRLRMLDMLSCLENLQLNEWEELMALEEDEFKDIEKKHGGEVKRLNSNLKWGRFFVKIKGSKNMDDGQRVKKSEFEQYAQNRTRNMDSEHLQEVDELRVSHAERRAKLQTAQKSIIETYIHVQDKLIGNIQLDELTNVIGSPRAPDAGSRHDVHNSEESAQDQQNLSSSAPEEAAPVAEETAPVAEETAPVAEETAPVAEETAPVAEDTAPVAEETAPVAEETALVAEETAPVAEETAPVTEETAPVAEETAPVADEFISSPVAGEGTPASAEETTPVDGYTKTEYPASKEYTLSAENTSEGASTAA